MYLCICRFIHIYNISLSLSFQVGIQVEPPFEIVPRTIYMYIHI